MVSSVPGQQDRCKPVVEERFGNADHVNRTVTEALTSALAAVNDVDVTELEPLYNTVDLDALAQLFDGPVSATQATFSFSYQEWVVVVRGDGRIQVCDAGRVDDSEIVHEAITA